MAFPSPGRWDYLGQAARRRRAGFKRQQRKSKLGEIRLRGSRAPPIPSSRSESITCPSGPRGTPPPSLGSMVCVEEGVLPPPGVPWLRGILLKPAFAQKNGGANSGKKLSVKRLSPISGHHSGCEELIHHQESPLPTEEAKLSQREVQFHLE